MILQKTSPDIAAYQLAVLLADELSLDVVLSDDVSPRAFFEFDSEAMTVYCSSQPIRKIAEIESACVKTITSYRAILEMANNEISGYGLIPECTRYATFCCLHEFGHFKQARDWSQAKLKEAATQRENLIAAAQREAQRRADDGASQKAVYSLFEERYRVIPIEKDADDKARTMLRLLAGDLRG